MTKRGRPASQQPKPVHDYRRVILLVQIMVTKWNEIDKLHCLIELAEQWGATLDDSDGQSICSVLSDLSLYTLEHARNQ